MARRKKKQISGKSDRRSAQTGATKLSWTYARYPSDDADWDRWYGGQSEGVRAKFDEVFETLEAYKSWHLTGYYEPLKDSDGLGEVKVKTGVQWRFFGFFDKGQRFILTMICNHKGAVYDPPEAIKTGVKRMKELKAGRVTAHACVKPGGDDDGED